jgi:hypothetical protein
MKVFAISGLTAMLAIVPAHAEPLAVQPAAAPAAINTPAAAPTTATSAVSEAASKASQDVAEVKAMFKEIYADVHKNTMTPGAREILVIGTGAGLGFLASGFIMTAWIAPLTVSLSGSLGLSNAASGIVTATVTTIGLVSGTYAGGIYARDLVSN